MPKPPLGGTTQIIGPIFSNQFIDTETGLPLACWTDAGRADNDERTAAAQHFGNPPAAYFVGAAKPRSREDVPAECMDDADTYFELRIMGIVDPLDDQRQLWAYHLPVECYQTGTLDVPTGSGEYVNAIDARITSVVWREINGVETLWATHDVIKYAVGPGDDIQRRKVVRWYKIATNGWPVSGLNPTLLDWGEIDAGYGPSNKHLFYPGLSVNAQGDMAIIMARSGRYENISIQAAGRFANDPPGHVGPLATVKLSNTPHKQHDEDQWGDYFTVVVDPSGDGTFWGFAAYMIDNVADPGKPHTRGQPRRRLGHVDIPLRDRPVAAVQPYNLPQSGSFAAADVPRRGAHSGDVRLRVLARTWRQFLPKGCDDVSTVMHTHAAQRPHCRMQPELARHAHRSRRRRRPALPLR